MLINDSRGPYARLEYGDMQKYDEKLDPTGGPPFISRRRKKQMDEIKTAFIVGFFDELEKVAGAAGTVGRVLTRAKPMLGKAVGWAQKNPELAGSAIQAAGGMGQQWMQQRHERRMQQQQQGATGMSGAAMGGAVY